MGLLWPCTEAEQYRRMTEEPTNNPGGCCSLLNQELADRWQQQGRLFSRCAANGASHLQRSPAQMVERINPQSSSDLSGWCHHWQIPDKEEIFLPQPSDQLYCKKSESSPITLLLSALCCGDHPSLSQAFSILLKEHMGPHFALMETNTERRCFYTDRTKSSSHWGILPSLCLTQVTTALISKASLPPNRS